jgi:transcriptional regulator with XRE-family HTH domain
MLDLILVGKRIAEIREQSNITQEVLAQELGISRTALSRLENGQRDISYEEMRKLSRILQVSPEDLVNSEDFEEKFALYRKTKPDQVNENLDKANEIIDAILGYEHLFYRFELGENK